MVMLYRLCLYGCMLLYLSVLYAESGRTDVISPIQSGTEDTPGAERVVLPGFSPLTIDGTNIILGGGRTYSWDESLLPANIASRAAPFVHSMQLTAEVDGRKTIFQPASVNVREASGHDANVLAEAVLEGVCRVLVSTTLEYDGFAKVEVTVFPEPDAKEIPDIYFSSIVRKTNFSKLVAHKFSNFRYWPKQQIFDVNYSGELLSVIGIVDGQAGFWWFIDEESRRLASSKKKTLIAERGETIEIKQPLAFSVGSDQSHYQSTFYIMATPVKNDQGQWRQKRVLPYLNQPEYQYGKYHLWWINAFAHQSYPYLVLDEKVKKGLPKSDVLAYKGLKYTKREISKYRFLGAERIPYFSAHTLPDFDPALSENRKNWEVLPPYLFSYSDKPFYSKAERPYLSYRSEKYVEYLLLRFSELIDKADFSGLYFDQANVIDSSNKAHRGFNNDVRVVTDIVATRDFYKRLATLFWSKGIDPFIAVHNSNTFMTPAYSFVSAMVQGEEFNQQLVEFDYFKSGGTDYVRTLYAPTHSGVPTVWLSQLWRPDSALAKSTRSKKTSDQEWLLSDEYKTHFNEYFSLALLHDVLVWSLSPLELRARVYKVYDDFRVEDATFSGYWNTNFVAEGCECLVSFYRNSSTSEVLAVVVNTGENAKNVVLKGWQQMGIEMSHKRAVDAITQQSINVIDDELQLDFLPRKNYLLVRIIDKD